MEGYHTKKPIDFTGHQNIHEPVSEKTICTCNIRLDRKAILLALDAECIIINGRRFKVPESELINILANKRYGEIRLDLELIQ